MAKNLLFTGGVRVDHLQVTITIGEYTFDCHAAYAWQRLTTPELGMAKGPVPMVAVWGGTRTACRQAVTLANDLR